MKGYNRTTIIITITAALIGLLAGVLITLCCYRRRRHRRAPRDARDGKDKPVFYHELEAPAAVHEAPGAASIQEAPGPEMAELQARTGHTPAGSLNLSLATADARPPLTPIVGSPGPVSPASWRGGTPPVSPSSWRNGTPPPAGPVSPASCHPPARYSEVSAISAPPPAPAPAPARRPSIKPLPALPSRTSSMTSAPQLGDESPRPQSIRTFWSTPAPSLAPNELAAPLLRPPSPAEVEIRPHTTNHSLASARPSCDDEGAACEDEGAACEDAGTACKDDGAACEDDDAVCEAGSAACARTQSPARCLRAARASIPVHATPAWYGRVVRAVTAPTARTIETRRARAWLRRSGSPPRATECSASECSATECSKSSRSATECSKSSRSATECSESLRSASDCSQSSRSRRLKLWPLRRSESSPSAAAAPRRFSRRSLA